MNRMLLIASAAAAAAIAAPAAAQSFNSTFEGVPGGPGPGGFTTVASADGWTGGAFGIELQNNVAGAPAPTGGSVFVELDTSANSSMSRTLTTGRYALSYLYSPRPDVGAGTNIIEVLLGNTLLSTITGTGGSTTAWQTVNVSPFVVGVGGGTLTFRAAGTSDSLGGYVDNISATVAPVPEPASWALMIVGFGAVGGAMRSRRRGAAALA